MRNLRFLKYGVSLCLALNFVANSSFAAGSLESIPTNKNSDLRLFKSDGSTLQGTAALKQMSGAELSMWVAGNQYFAMESLIRAFLDFHKDIKSVAVITLPPGEVASAIVKGGWRYEGADYKLRPDIYATVDVKHLKTLHVAGLFSRYFTYMHNELALLVRKGNPKKVTGIDSLQRKDLQIYLPNPVDEGIMSVYGEKILKTHKLWERLTAGKSCKACRGAANVYFTDVHHREVPAALKDGNADVGLVWKTEAINAVKNGLPVEEVSLPVDDSAKTDVNYMIGSVTGSQHVKAIDIYFEFLKSHNGQNIYQSFGFARADENEFKWTDVQ